jgi:2,4-dienoyl-CoA reductase-like NADH-dependent reductase (Old Yellow Enzyme family)
MDHTAIFQPLQLRHLTLRNRIVFGAHTANMSLDGLPGDRHLAYYRERAMGGAAMIVVEPVPIHRTAVLTRGNFRADDDSVIPHFRRITDAVHSEGAHILQQLYHVGAHGDWDNSLAYSWSPSGLPSMHDSDGSHAMTQAEITEIVAAFARCAARAKACGYDGCELMAAYNALIEQFWSPVTNRRDDEFGGSFENRMRFAQEVLQAVRKACGEDFVIGLAVSVSPRAPGRAIDREPAGSGRVAGPAPAVRLRHLRDRQLFRFPARHAAGDLRGQARRPLCRRAEAGGEDHPHPGGEPHPDAG